MILCKDCACEVKIEAWDAYKNNKIPLCFPCLKIRFQYYETLQKANRVKMIEQQSKMKAIRNEVKEERAKLRLQIKLEAMKLEEQKRKNKELAKEAKQAEEAKQILARKKYLEELIEKDKELFELFTYSKNSTTQQ